MSDKAIPLSDEMYDFARTFTSASTSTLTEFAGKAKALEQALRELKVAWDVYEREETRIIASSPYLREIRDAFSTVSKETKQILEDSG